ncbi:hypothetical protein QR680_010218 [Steinernema hermaphroditum]|uniref:F-box domain-containing protein n=1 Tax=Steinernema hermaphroditum TaxID=289476 RepID=A0AA39MBD6_9BILA|nr:hypothetical protein QR680_010218 [Steinernema hermaphroditum]
MDLLPYDLVDHLVQFLPRNDLETITNVACGRPELSNWQLMAEQHLEERYLLDIRIFVQDQNEPKSTAKRMKLEEGEEIDDKNEEIQVYVEKHRFTGELVGPWDFKKLQYASLRDVSISFHPWNVSKKHRPWERQKLLSILSLPVATRTDSSTRSSLSVSSGYHWIPDSRDSRFAELALKMIQVVQKTFAKVDIRMTSNGTNLRIEDFIQDYVDQGTFVEHMRFSCGGFEKQRIFQKGIVSLFKERRRTPLTVQIPDNFLTHHNIQQILEHWKNSDGFVASHKDVSQWKDGSGDFVVGQLRKATVGLSFNVWQCINDNHQAFYVHPRANSRLKIQESRYDLYTMSVVPNDPETVKDWNLNLLFGAE